MTGQEAVVSDPVPTAPLHFENPDDYRRLRERLDTAGFDETGLKELLGADGVSGPPATSIAVLLRRTAGGSTLETLARLFVAGVAVSKAAAAASLAPLELAWWEARGLVHIDGDEATATVQLRPHQGLLMACDFHRPGGAPLRRDHVMGVSPSSLTLAGLTIRRANTTALDLGTGCGFQALLASQHSGHVVATDSNPRAVEVARFNARINGLPQVVCREGNLFSPLGEDDAFDLIVSNPPFVVSPENAHTFLHSGLPGDAICRTIASDAPRFLRDGGYCQFLANWTSLEGEDWRDRLAGWVGGTGCDVWVLRRTSQAPEDYATAWIQTDVEGDGFTRAFDSWMDYYEQLGVERIDGGLVTMRRTKATPWFRADDAPGSATFPAGDDVLRRFQVEDLLSHDDDVLLAARFRLAPDVRLDQQSQQAGNGWETIARKIRRIEGLHWSGAIDSFGAGLLARCDGTRSMADLLDDLVISVGSGASPGTPPDWPGIVRLLVQRGFLERA